MTSCCITEHMRPLLHEELLKLEDEPIRVLELVATELMGQAYTTDDRGLDGGREPVIFNGDSLVEFVKSHVWRDPVAVIRLADMVHALWEWRVDADDRRVRLELIRDQAAQIVKIVDEDNPYHAVRAIHGPRTLLR